MFQTKVVQKIKTHILCSVTFPPKSCRLWDNVGKYCREGQDRDGNMAHAHCMMDTQGYKHTLRICNTYCFSISTTRLSVTLYVHRLSCRDSMDNACCTGGESLNMALVQAAATCFEQIQWYYTACMFTRQWSLPTSVPAPFLRRGRLLPAAIRRLNSAWM